MYRGTGVAKTVLCFFIIRVRKTFIAKPRGVPEHRRDRGACGDVLGFEFASAPQRCWGVQCDFGDGFCVLKKRRRRRRRVFFVANHQLEFY